MPSKPQPVQRARGYAAGTLVVVTRPSGTPSSTAIVIAPPLGYEDTCAYRPLRVLADALASAGHVVVRPDWPGLGDSLHPPERDTIAPSIEALTELARALRAAGARRVMAVGVRAGALIAHAAGCFDAQWSWAPPKSGKSFLREQKAFHRLAARSFGDAPAEAVLPEGAREAGGFLFSAATVAALQGLDGVPSDLDELGDVLENPYSSTLPDAARDAALDACHDPDRSAIGPLPLASTLSGPGWTERVWTAPGSSGQLVGVVCEPASTSSRDWTIFFNAGGIRRSGPGRLWTRCARALAGRGRPSLRFDVRDGGDSDGVNAPRADLEEMYAEASVLDALTAYDALDADHVDVVGLCSGAFLGAQVASRRDVRRALLFNGLAFVWNEDARASGMTDHIATSLLDRRRWGRLLTGKIDARRLVRSIGAKGRMRLETAAARVRGQAPPDPVDQLLATIRRRGTDLHLVSSEGDPSIAYLRRHVPDERLPRWTIVPAVDHTVRPVWAHEEVERLVTTDRGLWSRPR